MKSTRKSQIGRLTFGWIALTLSLATGARAQSPEFDAQTGSARISGGSPYADYRVDQAGFAGGGGHAVYQNFDPYSVYGGGYTPPAGAKLDPAFRAAAGLGGPSYAELDRIRFGLYHEGGDIAGLSEGYTNVGAFIPRRVFSDYNLFAINPRLLLDNSGNAGFNIGAIHRFYVPELDRMFGHSYWWDFSRSYSDEVQGFGWSFETIGRYFSFRLNANVLVGESQKIFSQQFFDPMLAGNNIWLPVVESFEAPVNNYSAEVAMPAPYLGKYGLELGAGPYMLTGSGVEDTLGVSARMKWQVTEDLWVGGRITNDNLFDTNVSFNLELTIPDGRPSRIARPNPVVMSLVQSVQRDYQVKVAQGQRTKYFAEVNPKTNLPFQIAIIDPNQGVAGNGSTYTPYNSTTDYMAAAAATRAGYDFILVNARNDGTDTNLDTGLVLTDTQHLFGNGANPSGLQPTYTSTRGTFFMPGIGTGNRPLLSNAGNPGGPVIQINGNATEIANLIIDGTNTGDGIVSTGAIDGFNIHDNTIQNVIDAVRITSNTSAQLNCPGEDIGIIERNVLNGVAGTGNLGASVTHIGGTLDLRIADNTLDPFANAGIEVISSGPTAIVNAAAAGGFPELGILRNTADQMGTGIRLRAQAGGQLLADVQDNVVTNSTAVNGAGLEVTAVNPGSTVVLNTLERNSFINGAGDGARLSATGSASILGTNAFTDNLFDGNGRDGFNASVSGAGSAIILRGIGNGTLGGGNSFTNNTRDGFGVRVSNGGQFTVIDPVAGNNFSLNGNHGFFGSANGPGSLLSIPLGSQATGLGNTFDNNGTVSLSGSGIQFLITNGATLLGQVVNNSASFNTGTGIVYRFVNTTQGTLNLNRLTATDNGGGGLAILAQNTTFNEILMSQVVADNNVGGDGILYMADNSQVAGRFRVRQSSLIGNGRNGLFLDLNNNSDIDQVFVVDNNVGGNTIVLGLAFLIDGDTFNTPFSITNTSGPGFDITGFNLDIAPASLLFDTIEPQGSTPFQPVNQTDVLTGLTTVNGTLITQGTNPLQDSAGVVLPDGGVADNSSLLDLLFNDFQPGETFSWLIDVDPQGQTATITGDQLIGSTITVDFTGGNQLTGSLQAVAGNPDASEFVATQGTFTSGGISQNGADGVRILQNNGSDIGDVIVDNNLIDANQRHGVSIETLDSRIATAGDLLRIANNTITNQTTGNGVDVRNNGSTGAPVLMRLEDNTISGNVGRGVNVDIAGTMRMQLVAPTNQITSNGNAGLEVTARDTTAINVLIGDPNEPDVTANLYDANTNAGVGINLFDNSFGSLTVVNSTFSNTVDGADPATFFNGDGVGIAARDDSTFIGQVTGSQFLTNQGAGIFGSATGDNLTVFSEILFFDIGGPNVSDGNLFDGNARGVHMVRTSNGRIGNQRPVNIQNNVIRNNFLDGIFLSSAQSFSFDFYTIQDNLIEFNSEQGVTGNPIGNGGIHLDAQADAQLRADILRNQITDNFLDGILVTDDSNFPSDQRGTGGTWQNNLIARNGGNGINLLGAVDELFIGSETDVALGNLIENNVFDGVNNISAGTWSLGNNLIRLNGIHGVDIGGVGFKDVRLVANHITLNGTNDNGIDGVGDGVEFQNNFNVMLLTMLGNVIDFNEGRGIDILNQNDAFSQILIGTDPTTGQGNIINGNGGEGIYVVNTASTTQNQSATTPDDPFANGADQPNANGTHKGMNADATDLGDSAFIDITIDNALVVANGMNDQATDFQATGIVFRVGTTGGGINDPSGFLSDVFASDQFLGGVVASITNTTMGGNFGDDLFFESFTSTVDPGTTGGTWDQNTFNPQNYRTDPLARLDLIYRNNTFLEDPTLLNPPALVTAQGAYYDNAEGVFKSRLSNIQAPNVAGPFASATRRRNAQRQPLRVYGDGTVLSPVVSPDGQSFMFPGMGDSTFRVDLANSDPIGILQQVGFLFDTNSPLFGQFDANGVFYPIGGNTQDGRSPWGWGTF